MKTDEADLARTKPPLSEWRLRPRIRRSNTGYLPSDIVFHTAINDRPEDRHFFPLLRRFFLAARYTDREYAYHDLDLGFRNEDSESGYDTSCADSESHLAPQHRRAASHTL